MNILNLSGQTALVTGVSDNVGFAFFIAKKLFEAGSKVIISCHPRVEGIVERFLTKDKYKESRMLSDGREFSPSKLIPCDVGEDESIKALKEILEKEYKEINTLIHSIAFSPEVDRRHLDVSRQGYLTSMSISSYSLVALCKNLLPVFAENGASVVALSYIAAYRAVPMYGGGMASSKAALECDARMLSWTLGELGHRINIVSPGPYASRAAKSIGDIQKMIEITKERSPLRREISPEDVANTVAFLASPLSKAITGETIYVDSGFHAIGFV